MIRLLKEACQRWVLQSQLSHCQCFLVLELDYLLANSLCFSVSCLPPLIYASVVCHRQQQRKAGRTRLFSEAEETTHIPRQDNGMGLMEMSSPPYAQISLAAGVPQCDGIPMNVQVLKTEERLPGDSSAREMASVTTRGGLDPGFGMVDVEEPYELYEPRFRSFPTPMAR